jgi:hypothetical protein
MHDRQIAPGDRVILELPRQPMMRPVRLRHHDKPRGILVDPVHDPRPLRPADPREAVAAVMKKRVDQRPRRRAGRGVDDHPDRLVDHDQVGILPDHRQRNRLRQRLDLDRRIKAQEVDLPLSHLRLQVGDNHAIQAYRPLRDHPGQTRPRQRRFLWHREGKRLIKAGGRVLTDGDG